MKVWTARPPQKEVRIVKTQGRLEYEFWLITAVKIGGAKRMGTSRIATDMGTTVPNLHEAIISYLDALGDEEYAEELRKDANLPAPTVPTDGMDIVIAGKWAQFCELRGLHARETSPKQVFKLSRAEITLLGMANDSGVQKSQHGQAGSGHAGPRR